MPYMNKTTNLAYSKSTNQEVKSSWYALRTTYGREKKAYDYMTNKGVSAFLPTIEVVKMIKGKRRLVSESRIPNMFFAYGTKEEIESFVYDNVNLPYLRFYYRRIRVGNGIDNVPMIVPEYQMDNLKIICASGAENIIITSEEVQKFKIGYRVEVVDGKFKGLVGRVARWQGQQRVGIVIEGLGTMVTAYVPKAFLRLLLYKPIDL